jgi:hypothetical protein
MSEQTEQQKKYGMSDDFGNGIEAHFGKSETRDAAVRFLLDGIVEKYFDEEALEFFQFI